VVAPHEVDAAPRGIQVPVVAGEVVCPDPGERPPTRVVGEVVDEVALRGIALLGVVFSSNQTYRRSPEVIM